MIYDENGEETPQVEMHLDAFEQRLRADVDKFFEMWRDQNRTNPEHFPMTMPGVADWYEQFLCDASDA